MFNKFCGGMVGHERNKKQLLVGVDSDKGLDIGLFITFSSIVRHFSAFFPLNNSWILMKNTLYL